MAETDTIFALATPPGRSALAVFRISGPGTRAAIRALTKRPDVTPRTSVLRAIFDPLRGEKIDQGLVTFFSSPSSFTGEDVAEISIHGGRAIISALSRALASLDGLRAAEPGEFTRRAYAAGKFDLAQAEAIADLIDSETEFQRRQALRLLDGGLGVKAEDWRRRLLAISAAIESVLDFSDEGDVTDADIGMLTSSAVALDSEMRAELAAGARSLAMRNGFTVVITGAPNAGKSSLLNALAGSEIALVTEHPGTTRDMLKVDLDLDGVPVTIIDSAGIRDTQDPVERMGIARAQQAIASADLVIHLFSTDAPSQDRMVSDRPSLIVWSKSDLFAAPPDVAAVSVRDTQSLSHLVSLIRERALDLVGDGTQGTMIRDRHKSAMEIASRALHRLVGLCQSGSLELAAEECRLANGALGRISGSFGAEDVLGEIFSRFCIGK